MKKIWTKHSLIAHRGASALAPENTLPALKLAKKMHAEWVEFDVVLSKEGEAFVFHDEDLDRTTNGQGPLSTTYAADLQNLDAGQWFSERYKNTPIPTLREWLDLAAHLEVSLNLNLEIKPLDHRVTQLVDVILATLKDHWPANAPALVISSFSIEALRYIRSRNSQLVLGLLLDEWREDWQELADELNCATIHLNWECVTKERVQAIHASHRLVACYTVNEAALAQRLFDLGVDAIFSNHVDLLANADVQTHSFSPCRGGA